MDEKRHVVDKRSVELEDVLRSDYIPFLGGRPQRITIISKDDITNLEIALNTNSDVNTFISHI